jgi:hypothetical protein
MNLPHNPASVTVLVVPLGDPSRASIHVGVPFRFPNFFSLKTVTHVPGTFCYRFIESHVLLLLFAAEHALGFRQSDPMQAAIHFLVQCGPFTLTCRVQPDLLEPLCRVWIPLYSPYRLFKHDYSVSDCGGKSFSEADPKPFVRACSRLRGEPHPCSFWRFPLPTDHRYRSKSARSCWSSPILVSASFSSPTAFPPDPQPALPPGL